MFARTTLFEIDTLRMSLDNALAQFNARIVPAMRQQEGYKGSYAMVTPEGRGMILTFWESEEAAQAGMASGYYDEQVAQFISFFRAPAGREQYEVVFAEVPAEASA